MQMVQEVEDPASADVSLGMEPEVEADLIAAGGHTEGTNDRDLLVDARALRRERTVATERPAPSEEGSCMDVDAPNCTCKA